jgi:chromate reductase, NAD(P)H dehydrogenase (quinone)
VQPKGRQLFNALIVYLTTNSIKYNRMITIISGTNRKNSNTLKVARQYQQVLETMEQKVHFVSLEAMLTLERTSYIEQLENDVLMPTTKFIFITPEYNGSIPGVLKLLIDITDIKKVWWGKMALLTGVSTGRAGNLRGMDHLTTILQHVKMNVHYNKLPLSSVDKLLNGTDAIADKNTVAAIHQQLQEFLQD